jgi:glycine oxidase
MQDVLIIGAGIVGLCSARALAARGADVAVLDASDRLPGASWAGGGILSPLFPWRHPHALNELCRPAVTDYQAMAAEIAAVQGPDPEVRVPGMLVLAGDEGDEARDWARRESMALSTVEAPRFDHPRAEREALWMPDVGVVRNPRLLTGLRTLLHRQGVRVHTEPSLALEPRGDGWRVRTRAGVREARRVLVAAGAWSRALLQPLGLDWPLMPVKGEMLRYPPSSGGPGHIVLAPDGYLVPRADGSVLAGSTLGEGDDDPRPSAEAAQQLRQAAETLWPPLREREPVLQWAGIRPGTRRTAPLIGAVPGQDGLYVATGHYRSGLTAAPRTAALITALINGDTPPLEPAPFAPDGPD